jgi:hypothetical protein
MDCKTEAHIDTQHDFRLLSLRDSGPVLSGAVIAFGNTGFSLPGQSHICEAPMKAPSGRRACGGAAIVFRTGGYLDMQQAAMSCPAAWD